MWIEVILFFLILEICGFHGNRNSLNTLHNLVKKIK